MRLPFFLFLLVVSALLPATLARAQEAPTTGGDPTVVDFVLPGHFKDALAASAERKRCLLIKGVAFGVDKDGATCATKGHW